MESEQLATNCEAAAARLAATGNTADALDAAALRAAAAVHRHQADKEKRAAEAARQIKQPAPAYWWHDRD